MKYTIPFLLVFFLLLNTWNIAAREKATSTQSPAPLAFIENKGQVTDQNNKPRTDIQYKLPVSGGLNIFVGNGSIHYQFNKPAADKQQTDDNNVPAQSLMYRMDVELLGANTHASVKADQDQEYYENYYTATVGKNGVTAKSFARITYTNIYPNIDWVLYTADGQLKHEFIVRKGGNVADIKLRYGGATRLSMNNEGQLVATTPQGTITENAPYSYEQNRNTVASRFVLQGNVVSYETGAYKGDLVIDPTLAWATYYGGTLNEIGYAVATSNNCVYMAGYSASTSNVATWGFYQSIYGGGTEDAFLAKFSRNGARVWATYYGGTLSDKAFAVTADASGNVYVAGLTASTAGIATTGAQQTTIGGGTNDAFLVKFNSVGYRQWGTYYGGTGAEDVLTNGLALDASGNVYLAGTTASSTGIATTGAHSVSVSGGNDGFLVKFANSGVRLWGTYYGGSGTDKAAAVACDELDNVYLAGNTTSSAAGVISTAGSHQVTYGGGGDGYLVKFNSAGTRQWGTYYGGTGKDEITGIVADTLSYIYVSGLTLSATGIATPVSYQNTLGGGSTSGDAFIAKFHTFGSRQWATYYGGGDEETFSTVTTDGSYKVYFAGSTRSTSAISMTGAYQPAFGGGTNDGFYTEFDTSGNRLYATYFGNTGDDRFISIVPDFAGGAFLSGYSNSATGIASAAACQTSLSGGADALLVRFGNCYTPIAAAISGPAVLCEGREVIYTNDSLGGRWVSSNTAVATIGSASGVLDAVLAGTTVISYTVTNACGTSTVTLNLIVNQQPAVINGMLGQTNVCPGSTITLTDATAGGAWSSSDPSIASISAAGVVTGNVVGNAVITYGLPAGCKSFIWVTTGMPIVSTVAGNGFSGDGGDGGPATSALFQDAWSVVKDGAGNLYIADATSHRVRKVNTSGIISTIAGTGVGGYSGDGIPATAAKLNQPNELAIDGAGNLYISDGQNDRIRKINTSGIISTIAGTGVGGFSGDGGPATDAKIDGPGGIDVTADGTIYFVDGFNKRVRKIDPTGKITTIAGTGGGGYTGDNGPATAAQMYPTIVKVGPQGHVYVTDGTHSVIRKIDLHGTITTIAGGGSGWGDGGPATAANMWDPRAISFDKLGNMYIAVFMHDIVRKVDPAGIISTLTVNPSFLTPVEGAPATVSNFNAPGGVMVDNEGVIYVADMGNDCIRKIYPGLPVVAPVSGPTTMCVGSSAPSYTLTNYGTWSSSDPTVATVATSGVVTAVSMGTALISYSVMYCTLTAATKAVTVNAPVTPITGGTIICGGGSTMLGNPTAGGSWNITPTSVAMVYSTGLVTGSSLGTATVTYSLSTGCYDTIIVSVVAPPAGILPATASVCAGNNITLTNATTGGTWTSGNPSVATVSASGVVTGITAGTAAISYTTGSCNTSRVVSVNASPAPITPAGPLSVCIGSTAALSGTGGATWSSSAPATATVDASGNVTGVAAGTVNISYTNSIGCFAIKQVSVITTPAAILPASPVICVGNTITLTNSSGGGTWQSDNIAVATVNSATGTLTGVTAGTATISYLIGSCLSTSVVTVAVAPSAGTITGPSNVCAGSSVNLANGIGGGTWSSSSVATATVSSGGLVTGVTAGTAIISYTIPASCGSASALVTISVNPLPAAITGTFLFKCPPATTDYTNATPGGTWSSSNTSIATINATTGTLTAVGLGTTMLTYTLPTGCYVTYTIGDILPTLVMGGANPLCMGSATTFTWFAGCTWSSSAPGVATIDVNTGAIATSSPGITTITGYYGAGCFVSRVLTVNSLPASIVGTATVCTGATTALACASPGGTWSSGATSIATISASGVVTGVAPGTAIISYTLNTGCAAATTVTVLATPSAITGVSSACVGSTTTLGSATSGGTWGSSATGIATVGTSSGIVSGIVAGLSTISYTAGNGCSVSTTVTVYNVPPPIVGTLSVCTGSSTALLNVAPSGTWASSNGAIATVNSSGVASGVSAGTATITYTIGTGCYATTPVSVLATPAALTGGGSGCIGGTMTLGSTTPGGAWSSSNTGMATVSTSGLVSLTGPGIPVITYTLASGCSVTTAVTINNVPPVITGTATVCEGAATALSDVVPSGTWSSSLGSVATIDAMGLVNGVAAGTATISYTLPTGCYTTRIATVLAAPAAITGTTSICDGLSSTLSSTTTGGTWSSSNTGVATVGIASGIVTAVDPGFSIISYTTANGCGVTAIVIVNNMPAAITGTSATCVGTSVNFINTMPGGTWSSSATGVATVGSSTGIVTGAAAGTAIITYVLGSGCNTTAVATVLATPVPIIGTTNVCVSDMTTLTCATAGGTWSCSATGIAGVGSSTGIVTGVSGGIAIISYTLGTGCSATTIMTVNTLPAAITGGTNVCEAATTTLANTTPGGLWISGATSAATVVPGTGVVTGVAAGTTTISYVISATGCIRTAVVSVQALPSAISGTLALCAGNITTLSSTPTGGTWSSSIPATAAVGTSGVVSALAAGTTLISYTLSTGCKRVVTFSVNALPAAIAGVTNVCELATTTLADVTPGGTWSSSAGTATVGPGTGIVTGISAGTAAISYIISATGCYTVTTITVNLLPAAITGSSAVCTGLNTTLSSATPGGTWSSSASGLVSVGSFTGIVTGVAAGSADITYRLPTGCYVTTLVTAALTPAAITGTAMVCEGASTTLASVTPGGTWSSSTLAVATISTSGSVTGVTSGTTTISYTLSTGCRSTTVYTVNPVPSPITGAPDVCAGSTTTLSDVTPGGTWTSSATGIATIVPATGVTTGVSAGIVNITYSLSTGCYSFMALTVNAVPAPITGALNVCAGNTTTLSDATPGGTWSCSATGIAAIDPATGTVSGLVAGTSAITYTLPAGCLAVNTATINPLPAPIMGMAGVCKGSTITMSNATPGGAWTSASPAIASINTATGVVTGVAYGNAVLSYSLATGCFDTAIVSVDTIPVFSVTGNDHVCIGTPITLTSSMTGGSWTSSNPGIATVSSTGAVSGVASGPVTISYSLSNICGTTTETKDIMVYTPTQCDSILSDKIITGLSSSIDLFPNPNEGSFSVIIHSLTEQPFAISIVNAIGQKVWHGTDVSNKTIPISLPDVAPGIYTLVAENQYRRYVIKFTNTPK